MEHTSKDEYARLGNVEAFYFLRKKQMAKGKAMIILVVLEYRGGGC